MLGARAARLLENRTARSKETPAANRTAKLSPEQREARWKIFVLKLLLVIRNYAFKRASQAILGEDAYRRIFQMTDRSENPPQVPPVRYMNGEVVGKPLEPGKGLNAGIDPPVVPASLHVDESSRQSRPEVVDMHSVPVSLGAYADDNSDRIPDGRRPSHVRPTPGTDLPADLSESSGLCGVGASDDRERRRDVAGTPEVGRILGDERSNADKFIPAGGRTDASEFHSGAKPLMMNQLFTGQRLSQLVAVSMIGLVGQVVSAHTSYRDLSGPVLSKRVGVFHSDTAEGPWIPVGEQSANFLQMNRTVAPAWRSGGSDESSRIQSGEESQMAVPARNSSGSGESRPSFQLNLFETTLGCFEETTEHDNSAVGTVPRSVARQLKQRLCPPSVSISLPLETVPEGPDERPADDEMPLPEEEVDDPNAEPDSDEEIADPPPNFDPTAQQLTDLKIAHDNSGHPSNADFARLLRRGNARPEVANWVRRNFRCEQCEAHRPPKARRPAAVPRTYRVNHVIGADLIELKNLRSESEWWLNVICWGSSFQLVGPVADKSAESVWAGFVRIWVSFFGMPEILVVDPGTEFQGYFAEQTAANGCAQLPTDARAPWQNGRTERAGKEWKRQFTIARRKEAPTNDSEYQTLGLLCCSIRNRYNNRSGFSPMQRVFGFTHRLPNSLLSDDPIDPQYLSENPLSDFQRSEALRRAATKAWISLDSKVRLAKVLRARHRIPENFVEGQLVFVWRQPRVGAGRWHGPGVIVLPTAGGAWINMRGSLWRVANEQMRGATQEESQGAEIVNKYLSQFKTDLQKTRGARRYVNVAAEGPPRFPGDPDIEGEDGMEDDDDMAQADRQDGEDSEPEGDPQPTGTVRPLDSSEGEPPRHRQRMDDTASVAETVPQPQDEPSLLGSPARAVSSPGNNFYVETLDSSSTPFTAQDGEVFYNQGTHNFYIRKKRPDEEISVRKLTPTCQKLFLGSGGSREKEWKAIQTAGGGEPAVRIHRGEAARKIIQQFPDRILPSRWHEKWKDMGDEFQNGLPVSEGISTQQGAKSRWIIQGFHDPDIAILNRTVPTPSTSDVPLALQVLSSIQASIWVGDVSSAFAQGLKGQRPERLFAYPPTDGFPGESGDVVVELLAEIYGLITGPPAWRKSLIETFRMEGFKKHPLAPCLALFYEDLGKGKTELSGLIVVETDDLLGGGIGEKFNQAVANIRKRFKFGKWIRLQEEQTEYGGRTLKQYPDFSITISMKRYLQDRAREIRMPKRRKRDDLATPEEVSAMRGLMGKINWAVREAMPQGAGDASLLSGTLPNPKVSDLLEANAALRRLLAHDIPIRICSIPLKDLRLLLFSDSGLHNAGGGHSQTCWMVCATNRLLMENARAPVSVLTYKSHKMTRAAAATLNAEANGLSEGLAETEWVASWLGLARDLQYNMRQRDTLNREFNTTAIISEGDSELDMAAIIDAKSLYDNLNREQYSGAERRAALEVCVIRDSLEALGGRARWVPHEENPVDCLSKLKGNTSRLLQLLRDYSFCLISEDQELERRKNYREQTGKRTLDPTLPPSSRPHPLRDRECFGWPVLRRLMTDLLVCLRSTRDLFERSPTTHLSAPGIAVTCPIFLLCRVHLPKCRRKF